MKCLVIGGTNDSVKNIEEFRKDCEILGKKVASIGSSLIVCSPFEDSLDYWALKGFLESDLKEGQVVEFHCIENEDVIKKVGKIKKKYFKNEILVIPSEILDEKPFLHSWLFCQIKALEASNFIVAMGGKEKASAEMLLLLAEAKRKLVIPLIFHGGASGSAFSRRRYELVDKFGQEKVDYLIDNKKMFEKDNLEKFILNIEYVNKKVSKSKDFKCFISYSRERPNEADYIETLLRRRNIDVFRDESDFGAATHIPTAINEALYSSNVIIIIWCAEYACSPWCYDEFQIALDKQEKGNGEIWIFKIDETRMVVPRARNLLFHRVRSRVEIDGKIAALINE